MAETSNFVETDISTWSEADYTRLLAEIEPVFLAPEGTEESDRADRLFDLIEAYEEAHYQIKEWRSSAKSVPESGKPRRKRAGTLVTA